MALQPDYTAAISGPMKERGVLVNRTIPEALRQSKSAIASALDAAEERLIFVGSDGVGQKTRTVGFASRLLIIHPTRELAGTPSFSLRQVVAASIYRSIRVPQLGMAPPLPP